MTKMMYIKESALTNYRNYKNMKIELGKKATIFIGRNGMGKTNLISALKQSLSFIFSKKSNTVQYSFIASSDQKVKSFLATDPRYVVSGDHGDYTYPIAVETTLEMEDGSELNWELRRKNSSRGIDESYAEKSVEFWKHYPKFQNLPVFAYFSDSYPHVITTIGTKMQGMLDSGNPLPKNVAYYKWDEERNCTEIWRQYFVMTYKNSMYKQNAEKDRYIKAINKCLVDFTIPISANDDNEDFEINKVEIEARGKEDVIVLNFCDGRRIPFDMLPQGYRRILSIVFDIAHRSYILNKNCEPHGVVFIDEVELHLHPSLAQEVVARLQRSFPEIQFVLSTHSPLVIADYKQDEEHLLYKLVRENDESLFTALENMYGMDVISVLHGVMDTPERDSYLNNLLGAYRYWKEAGDVRRASQIAKEIRTRTGEESRFYTQNIK